MQRGMVFNVWKDGEIHPTAVLAISGLGFDSLSNLQIGWHFLDVITVLPMARGCLLSPVPSASSTLAVRPQFVTAVYFNLPLNSPIRIFKTLKSNW